jgi:hypothetical protein
MDFFKTYLRYLTYNLNSFVQFDTNDTEILIRNSFKFILYVEPILTKKLRFSYKLLGVNS